MISLNRLFYSDVYYPDRRCTCSCCMQQKNDWLPHDTSRHHHLFSNATWQSNAYKTILHLQKHKSPQKEGIMPGICGATPFGLFCAYTNKPASSFCELTMEPGIARSCQSSLLVWWPHTRPAVFPQQCNLQKPYVHCK